MSQEKEDTVKKNVNSCDPSVELSDAIGRMCGAHGISKGSVPTDIDKVPAAIASILENKPKWGQSQGM